MAQIIQPIPSISSVISEKAFSITNSLPTLCERMFENQKLPLSILLLFATFQIFQPQQHTKKSLQPRSLRHPTNLVNLFFAATFQQRFQRRYSLFFEKTTLRRHCRGLDINSSKSSYIRIH